MVRDHLSGASNGTGLKVAVDSGTYTTVHTVTTTTADFEEIWVWLANIGTATEVVTFHIGGTDEEHTIKVQVPAESVILAIPGITLQGAGSFTVLAGASTADKISAWGHINLIDAA